MDVGSRKHLGCACTERSHITRTHRKCRPDPGSCQSKPAQACWQGSGLPDIPPCAVFEPAQGPCQPGASQVPCSPGCEVRHGHEGLNAGRHQNQRIGKAFQGRRELLLAGAVGFFCASKSLPAHAIVCPGLNGYALKQCFKEVRLAREQAEAEAAAQGKGTPAPVTVEQPGTLVTLPSGVRYREIEEGVTGTPAAIGSVLDIQYTVYRLSRGNTPVLLWSLGTGFEQQDDLDETYRFRLGDLGSLPAAATPAVVGMRIGGRRRIVIPPQYGWVDDKTGPRPRTFGGQRRLATHMNQVLLLEVVLRRCNPPATQP